MGLSVLAPGEKVLRRGLPERLVAEVVVPSPGWVVVNTVVLADVHGGRWPPRLEGLEEEEKDPSTLACILKADGQEHVLGTMTYG